MNLSYMETYEEFVEKEMEKHRKLMLEQLSDLIHPLHLEKFIMLLIDSWEHDLPDANTLVQEFNLNQKDFAAIRRDFDQFESILFEEMEESHVAAYY